MAGCSTASTKPRCSSNNGASVRLQRDRIQPLDNVRRHPLPSHRHPHSAELQTCNGLSFVLVQNVGLAGEEESRMRTPWQRNRARYFNGVPSHACSCHRRRPDEPYGSAPCVDNCDLASYPLPSFHCVGTMSEMTQKDRKCERRPMIMKHVEGNGHVGQRPWYFGIGRASFYRWKVALEKLGEVGLGLAIMGRWKDAGC